MGASNNTMSGPDWISESRHAFCIRTARRFEQQHKEALERDDTRAAEQFEAWGQDYLGETQLLDGNQPKRIVSDDEAAQLRAAMDEEKQAREDAEHLAALKTKLGIAPRANASAYRPYRGGLPTLGKDR
jgi:hypothetical protein